MQQMTELNIVATDDQEDHKVGKLAKEQLSQLNWAVGSITARLADKKHAATTTTTSEWY